MLHERERLAFLTVTALTLAPVACHGLWRPAATLLGARGDAAHLSYAALFVAIVVLLVSVTARKRVAGAAAGVVIAALLAAVLGSDAPSRLAAGAALAGVAGSLGVLVPWLSNRLPHALDGLASRHRIAAGAFALVCALCILQTARVSTFMGDPARTEYQAMRGVPFLDTHSCLTAYVHAATLAHDGVDNLYDARFWPDVAPTPEGARPVADARYAPFDLDTYAYPPPFLLLASVLRPLDGHYLAQRALWFGLSGALLTAGLWILARWLDDERWHRALLLLPLLWLSAPSMLLLQVGNVQASVTVVAMLGMVAFDRKRHALGGALLSFAILSKIAPGALAVWLLAQRRWRDAAWTASFGLLWLLLSVAAFGTAPLVHFVTYELPRLSSGEALRFLADTPFNIITNVSPFGFPFRLTLAGISITDPWAVARKVSLAFSVLVVAATVVAGLRRGGRREQACTWLALLTLGALRSPFAPGYVCFGALWLLSLLAIEARNARAVAAIAGLWVLCSVPLPLPVAAAAVFGVAPILLLVVVLTWVAVRKPAFVSALDGGLGSLQARAQPRSTGA